MQLVVARIGRPHGIRGEVSVEVRTDAPGDRLARGVVLSTDPPDAGPLTVATARDHNGRVLLTFEEVPDRTAAEHLRGILLLAEIVESTDTDAEPDAWRTHELVGLRVETTGGDRIGTVADVRPMPAQDLLVVELANGEQRLVPFVTAIVPEVDVAGGRIVLDPPDGLI
ncbi:MAG TPA: ribosome maturation factor RimM [Actinomycetales bacterium]|nr:ribosome maturation factor RimM [Actinomycetales bacterium]